MMHRPQSHKVTKSQSSSGKPYKSWLKHSRIGLPIGAVLLFFAVFACNPDLFNGSDLKTSEKSLTVHRLGFDLEKNQFVNPGETVKIFAKSNRSLGITYDWEVSAGTFIVIEDGVIEYTIPDEAGDYSIIVKINDSKNGQSAQRMMNIKVGSLSAIAVPTSYSMKMTQTNSINMKVSGEMKSATVTNIWVDGDTTIVKSETNDSVSVTKNIGEEMFASDTTGKMRLIGNARELGGLADDALLFQDQFETYKQYFGQPGRNGADYVFSKSENGIETLLYVNSIGFPVKNFCKDGSTGETTETFYTYQDVDGYVFPESITQVITIPIADEIVKSTMAMKFEEISLNIELPDDEELAAASIPANSAE